MHPPSSSTSSSDASPRRRAWTIAAWVLGWLVLIDIAINLLFPYPSDPRDTRPGALALFFDYGRSMEGRLRRATRADPAQTAPITLAGWYRPLVDTRRPAPAGAPEVTIYGMSHAMLLADALHAEAPGLAVRTVGAPGATTNWSFGAFRRDTGAKDSKVVVLAIMASTLPMITSPAPMDWNTSFAMPYTADRYTLHDGKLAVTTPPYDSFAAYVATLDNPAAWERAQAQFARTDPFYDRWLVRASWMDHSTLARLARAAWAQSRDRKAREGVLTATGYDAQSEPVRLANGIIADFARTARQKGQLPVIYIVNNFGFGDQLYRALADTLVRDAIPHLSSHTLINPADPGAYLPDTHFTPDNDRRLARALASLIDDELAKAKAR